MIAGYDHFKSFLHLLVFFLNQGNLRIEFGFDRLLCSFDQNCDLLFDLVFKAPKFFLVGQINHDLSEMKVVLFDVIHPF